MESEKLLTVLFGRRSNYCCKYALVAEQADVRVLETRAARRVSSILTESTVKCVGGQVLKSLGRNPKERELKPHPMLHYGL